MESIKTAIPAEKRPRETRQELGGERRMYDRKTEFPTIRHDDTSIS